MRIRIHITGFMIRNQRETQILETLRAAASPLGSMDLVKSIYRDTPVKLHGAAQFNVEHHLEKLRKEGRVVAEDEKWSAR